MYIHNICSHLYGYIHPCIYVSHNLAPLDYLPLRMLHISPGETTLFLPKPIISDRRAYGPICAAFTPTADSTLHLFVFYANGTQKEVNTAFNVPTFIDDVVTIYAHNLTDGGNPRIQINFKDPLNDTEISKFFQRQFRCVVISRWEQLSVNFTINITSEAGEEHNDMIHHSTSVVSLVPRPLTIPHPLLQPRTQAS